MADFKDVKPEAVDLARKQYAEWTTTKVAGKVEILPDDNSVICRTTFVFEARMTAAGASDIEIGVNDNALPKQP
jgi:hypothetical protein